MKPDMRDYPNRITPARQAFIFRLRRILAQRTGAGRWYWNRGKWHFRGIGRD